MHLRTDVVQG